MIGKPEWFKKKKFGWGLTPVTWQGWVYVASLTIPLILIHTFLPLNPGFRVAITLVFIALIFVDTFDIMKAMKK